MTLDFRLVGHMSKELIRQLKDLKQINDQLTPDRVWVEKNRGALLQTITVEQRQTISTPKEEKNDRRWAVLSHLSIFVPRSLGYMRPALMVFVALGVLTSGWIATASAKLGDAFYPVKIAAEKTQVALVSVVGDESTKAKLHLQLASKRAEEVKESATNQTASSPEEQKKMVVAEKKAIDSMQASIEKSKEIVKNVSEKDPNKAADILQETHTQTEAILGSLKDAVTNAKDASPELTEEVEKTTKEVREGKLETIQTVLEKNTENEAVRMIAVEAIDAAVRDAAVVASSTVGVTPSPVVGTALTADATTTPGTVQNSTSTQVVPLAPVATVQPSISASSSIGRVLQQGTANQPVSTPELIQALGEARVLTTTVPPVKETMPIVPVKEEEVSK